MAKVIVTAAITGGIHTPSMSPYLPITPEQIAEQAIGAYEAGAAVVHIHIRNPETGQPSSDMILVGDSMGMCVYGYPAGTMPVTMDECIVHTDAVRRGAPNTFVMGDMPFLSYQTTPEDAVRNAGRFYKEAGVDAIKLEGGRRVTKVIRAIVDAGMVVCGHI
ncbi:unnamed protein product, partial [marine sediment metagenome]